jgi:hypothetical protein
VLRGFCCCAPAKFRIVQSTVHALILRDKRENTKDNGVWLATTEQHHESLRREFPNMAIHSCTREGSNGLAGHSGRCGGFRGGSAARLRSRPGRGSSDRQGAGGAAGLWIGARKAPESLKGGEVPQERRERSREVVHSPLVAKETFIELKNHATTNEGPTKRALIHANPTVSVLFRGVPPAYVRG